MVNVTVTTTIPKKSMRQISNRIEDAAGNAVYKVANESANIAEFNAPKSTRKLRGYIRSEKTSPRSARVISRMPTAANYTDTPGFSLPLWLHAGWGALDSNPYAGTRAGYYGKVSSPQAHLSTGTAKYMLLAANHAEMRAEDKIQKHINNII